MFLATKPPLRVGLYDLYRQNSNDFKNKSYLISILFQSFGYSSGNLKSSNRKVTVQYQKLVTFWQQQVTVKSTFYYSSDSARHQRKQKTSLPQASFFSLLTMFVPADGISQPPD
jgi:hypothetical protein